MDIDATVSGPAANSYLTIGEADDLMDGFAQVDRWDELDPDDQARLLFRGTRYVDRYKTWPPKKDKTQRLAFPTEQDPAAAIPEAVKLALLEFIDATLEGSLDGLKQLQAEGVSSASIGGQSSSFEADPSLLTAGARRELDRLWDGYNAPQVGERPYDGSADPDCKSLFG